MLDKGMEISIIGKIFYSTAKPFHRSSHSHAQVFPTNDLLYPQLRQGRRKLRCKQHKHQGKQRKHPPRNGNSKRPSPNHKGPIPARTLPLTCRIIGPVPVLKVGTCDPYNPTPGSNLQNRNRTMSRSSADGQRSNLMPIGIRQAVSFGRKSTKLSKARSIRDPDYS
ncbi:hypothetical protein BJX63DRAFT_416833 [Aspergillus granulosus]|uniref:Uncharacterized protein n=1 Tax=Aspergillus granulosus TaxID=176169 RepID=A0ABR4GRE1_9EURO